MDKPLILIGTPIRDTKSYVIERWVKFLGTLTWPNLRIWLGDNSDDVIFKTTVANLVAAEKVKDVTVESVLGYDAKHDDSRLAHAHSKSSDLVKADPTIAYWMSLECDVFPPTDVIERMLPLMDYFDVVAHSYPQRDGSPGIICGLGCTLVKRSVIESVDFLKDGGFGDVTDDDETTVHHSNDGLFFYLARKAGFKIAELINYFEVKHI